MSISKSFPLPKTELTIIPRLYDPELLSDFIGRNDPKFRSSAESYLSEIPAMLNDLEMAWARMNVVRMKEIADTLMLKVRILGAYSIADTIRNIQRSLQKGQGQLSMAIWVDEIRQKSEMLIGQVKRDCETISTGKKSKTGIRG